MVWKVKKAGQRFNECRLFGVEDLQRPLNSTTTTTSGCCFGAVAFALACGSILLTAPYFGQFSWRCRAVSVGKRRTSASLENVVTRVLSCAAAFKTAVL